MDKKILWKAIPAGTLSAIAVSVSGTYVQQDTVFATLSAELDGVSLTGMITLIALCALFCFAETRGIRRKHWTVRLLALIYAGFMLIGLSFSRNGNWSFVIGTFQQMVVALIVLAGYYLLFEVVVGILYYFLDRKVLKNSGRATEQTYENTGGSVNSENTSGKLTKTGTESAAGKLTEMETGNLSKIPMEKCSEKMTGSVTENEQAVSDKDRDMLSGKKSAVTAQYISDDDGKEDLLTRIKRFAGRHVYLTSFFVIFICWLPWILTFLPASLPYDGCKAILQGLGEVQLTDQHGWALALLMGALMSVGQHVSDNVGLFLVLAVFVLFELLCYAGVCKVVSRWKLPRAVWIVLALFFGIFPIFGAYAQAVIKDSVFLAAFTLYMALYIDLALRGRKPSGKEKIVRGARVTDTCSEKTNGQTVNAEYQKRTFAEMNESGEMSASTENAKNMNGNVTATASKKADRKKTVMEEKNENRGILLEVLLLLLIGYLACAMRNNGIYLVLLASVFLIVLFRKGLRRYAVLLVVGAMALNWFHNSVLAEAAGVTSVTDRVKLSVTFQIAGRYMSECPEDLTEEEKEALSGIFYGLDSIEEIGELYNPQLSDPVKAHYRTSSTEEEINAYMEVIVSMFKKHPGICIQALLNQAYGYIYPFYNCDVMGTYQFYMTKTTTSSFDGLEVSYVVDAQTRMRLNNYTKLWKNIPGLSQVTNPAFPTWVLFFLAGYLAYRKKWKEILVLGAPSLNMAICAVSPVNGLLRYAMPSMACLPLLVLWGVMVKEDSSEENCQELS